MVLVSARFLALQVTPAERVWIAWQPLKRKLDGRYPLTKNQVNVFAKLILEINAAEGAIAGDFFSTSMHRSVSGCMSQL